MIVVLVYLTVAVGVAPRTVRRRYGQLRASHPHTHPRDVRHDLTHAAAGGVWRALLWGPRLLVWAGHRLIVWVTVRLIGRRVIALHLRDARVEMYEAELAAFHDDEELLVTVRALRRRVEDQEARVSRMLSA